MKNEKIEKRLCRYFFKNEKICKAFFDAKNYFLATRTDTGARPKNKNLLSGCAANFEKIVGVLGDALTSIF